MPTTAPVRTFDAHVAGGTVRIIVSGLAPARARTLEGRRDALARRHDGLRRALLTPPRGGLDVVGALLTEPVTPGADAGVLFLTGAGWPPFSGHGLIAVATLAVERGLVTAGRETPSRLVFDTLAGPVPARLDVGRAAEAASGGAAPRVSRVSCESPPARVLAGGLPLAVAGRTVLADLVSCAGLFAIVDSESAGVALGADTLPELRRAAVPISGALEARARKVPKDVAGPCGVNVVFIGPSNGGSSDLRSATVAPGGHVSLSPSGRATAAIVAVLDVMGMLPADRSFANEGLQGLALEGRVLKRSTDDPPALTVEISGTAWPTGDHEFVFCAGDPTGPGPEGPGLRRT
jgi:proline racemase